MFEWCKPCPSGKAKVVDTGWINHDNGKSDPGEDHLNIANSPSETRKDHIEQDGDDEDDEDDESYDSSEDDGLVWAKKVDPDMWNWITSKECEQDFPDKYFNNPPHRKGV